MRSRILAAELPAAPENGARAAGVGRSAGVDDLSASGHGSGQRRHNGVDLVVGQLLGLIVDDQGYPCEASGPLAGSGGELNAPAVFQFDGLLAVGVTDEFDHPLDLRVPPVGEHALQAPEALFPGHDLVRRVQDLLPADHQPEELPGLQADVLSVLPGCGKSGACDGVVTVLVLPEPAVHHAALPVREGYAVGLHQRGCCRAVGAGSIRLHADPRLLASGHSANFSRTRSRTVTFSGSMPCASASPRTVS